MSDVKFCFKCKHNWMPTDSTPRQCRCPFAYTLDLVEGAQINPLCSEMRSDAGQCGYHGNWFEPKP